MKRKTVTIGLKSGRTIRLWDCLELNVKYDREDGSVTGLTWKCRAPWWKAPLRLLGLSRVNTPLFICLDQVEYVRQKV